MCDCSRIAPNNGGERMCLKTSASFTYERKDCWILVEKKVESSTGEGTWGKILPANYQATRTALFSLTSRRLLGWWYLVAAV